MQQAQLRTQPYSSPCGPLLLGCIHGRLCLCDWVLSHHHARVLARLQQHFHAPMEEGESPTLRQAAEELDAYFAGRRPHFQIPLLMVGTPFQQRVWQQLPRIPCGASLSYGELAQALGIPTAARAVANAVGANAISLFLPCHRVTGSHGRLGGYAGGNAAKQQLLWHERAMPSFF